MQRIASNLGCSSLASAPKLLDMIERQIGPNITFWSSHLLCKPPHTGRDVPWHQDAKEWNLSGNFGASIWIPLDDVDTASGTMSIIPGWHRKGALRQIQRGTARDDFLADIDPAELPDDLAEVSVTYHLRAGQAAIHHVMMPHSSTPNTSEHWRRVLIFRYLAADGELGPGTYHDYRTNAAVRASVLPGPRPRRERQGPAAQSILSPVRLVAPLAAVE